MTKHLPLNIKKKIHTYLCARSGAKPKSVGIVDKNIMYLTIENFCVEIDLFLCHFSIGSSFHIRLHMKKNYDMHVWFLDWKISFSFG